VDKVPGADYHGLGGERGGRHQDDCQKEGSTHVGRSIWW
ncbi:MAG: hypothetical protein ACI9W4_001874, partial [Rhodothermales bacterium]